MRVLVVHNSYQKPGGEDVAFHSEAALLEGYGHEVLRYTADNSQAGDQSRVVLAVNTIWNASILREVRALIQRTRPDVMHVHNILPLVSPAVYHAARSEGVPVVQTLHNFRLLCPKAELHRGGKVCEECIGTTTCWPGVVHGCYRGSRVATGVVAAMVSAHRLLGTWQHKISRYVAVSEFMKRKYVQGGWPADKISVKPNFFDYKGDVKPAHGGYALFAGRLSEEKGVKTLLSAVGRMPTPPLMKIAGQGPLMSRSPGADPNVEWLGQLPRERIVELMKGASVLVFPSEWYEGSPLTIIEAFAIGLPVIASRLGNMAEMITDRVTGLLFTPADPEDLAAAIGWALAHPTEMQAIGRRAREEFEHKYTPDRNYEVLMQIYEATMNGAAGSGETVEGGGPACGRVGVDEVVDEVVEVGVTRR